MILHFININKYISTIIFLALMFTLSSNNGFGAQKNIFYLPDGTGSIFWKCSNQVCNIYLKKKNGNVEVLLDNYSPPTIEALNQNLVKLFFSCGSPCNYTFFYDSKNGLSRSFEFVIASDLKRKIVLIAESDELTAYKIFEKRKPLIHIQRDWSPTVSLFSDILEAKFINNHLYLKYLMGNDFKEKEETIKI